jgi:hypothetical protein
MTMDSAQLFLKLWLPCSTGILLGAATFRRAKWWATLTGLGQKRQPSSPSLYSISSSHSIGNIKYIYLCTVARQQTKVLKYYEVLIPSHHSRERALIKDIYSSTRCTILEARAWEAVKAAAGQLRSQKIWEVSRGKESGSTNGRRCRGCGGRRSCTASSSRPSSASVARTVSFLKIPYAPILHTHARELGC